MNPPSAPLAPPSTLPAPAAPAELRPDTSAYHWLDLPVAWTDLQGRLLGANPAFEAATGHRADAVQARRLTDLLGLDDNASDPVLAHGLASGLDFAPLPFAGRDAQGRPLVGLLGQRCQAGLCIVTLQPAPSTATPPQPSRFWDLRALRDGIRGALTGPVVQDGAPPPGALDTPYPLDTAQARFDMASTLAGIGIWQHDAATGLLHCNRLGWSLLGLPAQPDGLALDALAHGLASGLDFAPLPFVGRDAHGQPLVGLLGQRCQAGLCIVTLQPAPSPATPPQPSRFWDLRALRDGIRGALTGPAVQDSAPPPGALDTPYPLDTAQARFDMASTLAGIGICNTTPPPACCTATGWASRCWACRPSPMAWRWTRWPAGCTLRTWPPSRPNWRARRQPPRRASARRPAGRPPVSAMTRSNWAPAAATATAVGATC